jgi:hypothetical protein
MVSTRVTAATRGLESPITMPPSLKCPLLCFIKQQHKNTDYKVIHWYILHVILVRLSCAQFILDAWWWDSHRSNREQNGVSLHSSFHDRFLLSLHRVNVGISTFKRILRANENQAWLFSRIYGGITTTWFWSHVEASDPRSKSTICKKWSNNEIVQMSVPAYPRNTHLKDLIVVSRIDRVIEEKV